MTPPDPSPAAPEPCDHTDAYGSTFFGGVSCLLCGAVPDTIDAAWAAAAAALHPGWEFGGIQAECDDDPSVPDDWHAWAGAPAVHCPTCRCQGHSVSGRGATPSAALRALAAAIEEVTPRA